MGNNISSINNHQVNDDYLIGSSLNHTHHHHHGSSPSPSFYICNGCNGPSYGEPFCMPCHAFVYGDGSYLPPKTSTTNQVAIGVTSAHQNISFVLPPELWLTILKMLKDDTTSLLMASSVCTSWNSMIQHAFPDTYWEDYVKATWPLVRRITVVSHAVQSWHCLAIKLMNSVCCKPCYKKMIKSKENVQVFDEGVTRKLRLRNEIKQIQEYAQEGIEATPLDGLNYNWLGAIKGPIGSPYEGGKFYLHLTVGPDYPWKPPTVRFLTKIYHPNISRHGDIGIDITYNWAVCLRIPVVLYSIQCLLTLADPPTIVNMESDIASLYATNRVGFEKIARDWTRKYAMHEILQNE